MIKVGDSSDLFVINAQKGCYRRTPAFKAKRRNGERILTLFDNCFGQYL
jgi:hypothetical protein